MCKRNSIRKLLKYFCFVMVTIILVSLSNIEVLASINKRELDSFVEKGLKTTSSVSLAVIEEGKVTYLRQEGKMNIENNIITDENSVYEWGSVSKLLVWVAVMQLEEEGKLNLNEDIRTYLPEGYLNRLKYNDKITLLNLMNHNAGFQEIIYLPETKESKELKSLEETLKEYMPPQIWKPGETVSYSNFGASLAGLIVERVSKKEWSAYVKENILNPLGMEKTGVKSDRSDNDWVKEKRKENGSYYINDETNESLGSQLSYIEVAPAGAAAGTFGDFIKFVSALTDKKAGLFKKTETYDKFFSSSLNYTNSEITRISHGMWSLPIGDGIKGHAGNTSGYTASIFTDGKKTTAVMTNEVGETYYNYGFLSAVFGSYKGQSKSSNIPSDTNISGIYTASRTTFSHGFGKISKYLGMLLPISYDKEGGDYKIAIGNTKINKIPGNQYTIDNGNGMVSLLSPVTREDGRVIKIESYTMDVHKEGGLAFLLEISLILLLLISIILSLVMVINGIIRIILGKRKEETVPSTIVAILIILSGFLMSNLLLSDGLKRDGAVLYSIGISLISFILLIFLILKFKKNGKIKVYLNPIMTITSLFVILNVMYWELYNFWFY